MNREERVNQMYNILVEAECALPLRAICDRAGVRKAGWVRDIMVQLENEGLVAKRPVTYTNRVVGYVYSPCYPEIEE